MKKFFSVIVAIMLCACMLVPTAAAADDLDLESILEGVDLGGLTASDLEAILGDLDLEGVDLEAIVESFEGDDSEPVDQIQSVLQDMNSVQASNSGNGAAGSNNFDLTSIISLIPVEEETANLLTGLVSALSDGGLESLMSTVVGTFSGQGISLTSYEAGGFNISQLAETATQTTSTIADMIFSALEGLGLDTTTIEGLLDNEIVNFFANLYIGFIGQVEESTVPPVVTTKPPKTGDTSAVIVALGTLAVASGAAFVCLKKKEEE